MKKQIKEFISLSYEKRLFYMFFLTSIFIIFVYLITSGYFNSVMNFYVFVVVPLLSVLCWINSLLIGSFLFPKTNYLCYIKKS